MQRNSFQKNGFLNVNNNVVNNNFNGNFGARKLDDIRSDMLRAKTSSKLPVNQEEPKNTYNKPNLDHRRRVENIHDFNRWK